MGEAEGADRELRLSAASHQPGWPRLADEALHGLAGDFVRLLEPHTESDPAAVLVQLLACFGSVVGRRPHFRAEADRHGVNLFCCLVGETAKGRKGSSAGHVRALFDEVDPIWNRNRVQSGLSSGEGLIWSVRDPITRREPMRRKGRERPSFREVVSDPGVSDKRLCIFESEFASTLRVLQRDGNTLSPVLRNAWDSGELSSLTKNSPAAASGAHISLVAHITRQELLRHLDSTEAGNGFGNRYLWLCVKRSKCLPEGGRFHEVDRGPIIERLQEVVKTAKGTGELRRSEPARGVWREVYPKLSEGRPGLFGAVIARSEAQVMRLACLYALLDGAREIEEPHLLAALAVWDYAERSAHYIFGDALGEPVADQILHALRESGEGMSRSAILAWFGHHRRSREITQALERLRDQGLAASRRVPTGGRPAEVWVAT